MRFATTTLLAHLLAKGTVLKMPERIARLGDLWQPLLAQKARFRLDEVLDAA